MNRGERDRRGRRRLGHGDGADVGGLGQGCIERAQERPAAAGVMLPGILAVEDHANGTDFPAGGRAESSAGLADPLDEICGRRTRVPSCRYVSRRR